jgi:hypothetical protein
MTKEEVEKTLRIIQEDKQRRDDDMRFFRNASLLDYTEVSIKQFIGFREKPAYKKDYQYNVFDQITRDKVMAILSKSAGLYEAEFFNTNKRLRGISETISTVLGAFYKDSTKQLKEKEKNKLLMLAALITPKAIWYEGWRYQPRTIQDIEERDESGRITKTSKKKVEYYNGPWGEIVSVEDFIPGSLKIRDLQEQPRITWIPKMQIETFRRMYSKYPNAKDVQPSNTLENGSDLLIRDDLKDNEVEVVRYYDKWNDELTIIANSILLDKTPMPFAHKDYPFVWGGFEELYYDFVYDMPLTMKLLDMQDMNNEILNLSLDMCIRALSDVILTSGGDDINDDVIYSGGLIPVNDPRNFQKFEFGSNAGFNMASQMRETARRSIEASSVDAPLSGQSGTRSVTAREALIAREAALEITSLFLQNMENMERDKAILRVKNQLDRYNKPKDWSKRIGDHGIEETLEKFREFNVRDTKLDGGKRGTAIVNITNTPRTKEELDEDNIVNDKELSQTIDISPEIIRQIEPEVEVVANSSIKKTKQQEAAEARLFYSDALATPQILNLPYAAEEYVKALGKIPQQALAEKKEQEMQEGMPEQQGIQQEPPQLKDDGIESLLNGAI